MLNRRNFIRASGIALTGLASLVWSVDASPKFNPAVLNPFKQEDLQKELERAREEMKYAKESMIFSYEEWKAAKEEPKFLMSEEEIKAFLQAQIRLRKKARLIILESDIAYSFFTKNERDDYESELKMLEPIYDKVEINQKYGLDFTTEQFQKSLGAKILWYLEREYGYRYSDEQANKQKK